MSLYLPTVSWIVSITYQYQELQSFLWPSQLASIHASLPIFRVAWRLPCRPLFRPFAIGDWFEIYFWLYPGNDFLGNAWKSDKIQMYRFFVLQIETRWHGFTSKEFSIHKARMTAIHIVKAFALGSHVMIYSKPASMKFWISCSQDWLLT